MLENEIIDHFQKTIAATIKSIGKSSDLEINFVEEKPSIDGKKLNLTFPSLSLIKNNLDYIRGEADIMALQIRLHNNDLHNKFLSNDDTINKIFNSFEKSRIEASGSNLFKCVKLNIFNKNNKDIKKISDSVSDQNLIINAFKYVSYGELTNQQLDGKYSLYRNILKKKLGVKYNKYFKELRQNINNQEKFAQKLKNILGEIGLLKKNKKNDLKNDSS